MEFIIDDERLVLKFIKGKYADKSLAVAVEMKEEDYFEPFATLTKNLGYGGSDTTQFIDENNLPKELIEQLEDLGYIKFTYNMTQSGFCIYRHFEFSKEFLDLMEQA